MSLTHNDFDEVVGLVGLKASGKDVCSGILANHGCAEWRISDPIRAEAARRNGSTAYTMSQLMDIGNEFRAKGGPGYPAQLMLEMAHAKGDRKVVVNGLRNPGEIWKLREIVGHRLYLIGITAPIMVRFARASARHQPEDPLTLEQFLQNDDRDRGIGEPPHGQHVDRTLAMVAEVDPEAIYCNQGTLADYHNWINAFVTRYSL